MKRRVLMVVASVVVLRPLSAFGQTVCFNATSSSGSVGPIQISVDGGVGRSVRWGS